MNPALQEVHNSLLNMILALRRANRESGVPRAAEEPSPWRDPVWWVLVCGERLDPYSMERRDQARERLRGQIESKGIEIREHVWVWDSTGIAQVVVGEHETREEAELHALELRQKGLRVRVRREMRETLENG